MRIDAWGKRIELMRIDAWGKRIDAWGKRIDAWGKLGENELMRRGTTN